MLEKATENFMSLKANEVNIRSGPGRGFSIVYTYKLKHVPVRLMGKYDKWFKIADRDGDIGWVSESLLSKIRTVITINEAQLLYYSFTESSFPLCRVEKNVVGRLIKCKKRRCMVKIGKTTGWLSKSDIWGHSI
jgi:SH3-like domain-containing protein